MSFFLVAAGFVLGALSMLALRTHWLDSSAAVSSAARQAESLDRLIAEDESRIWAEAYVNQALAAAKSRDLSSVAPVLEFPTQRTAGGDS